MSGGGDRHELCRVDVDVVDLVRRHGDDVALAAAGEHEVLGELALGVIRASMRLRDDHELLFLRGVEVVDLVGDDAASRPFGTAS